jgi:hypothetical protein
MGAMVDEGVGVSARRAIPLYPPAYEECPVCAEGRVHQSTVGMYHATVKEVRRFLAVLALVVFTGISVSLIGIGLIYSTLPVFPLVGYLLFGLGGLIELVAVGGFVLMLIPQDIRNLYRNRKKVREEVSLFLGEDGEFHAHVLEKRSESPPIAILDLNGSARLKKGDLPFPNCIEVRPNNDTGFVTLGFKTNDPKRPVVRFYGHPQHLLLVLNEHTPEELVGCRDTSFTYPNGYVEHLRIIYMYGGDLMICR